MREAVLRGLAGRVVSDPDFLSGVRRDPEGTLARYGYDLTSDELEMVLDLHRRTAALGDGTLAALNAGGLKTRTGKPPTRPGGRTMDGTGTPEGR